jgi:hypothetical protein
MTENWLTTESKCIPGTQVHSFYLCQGKVYYIFPDLTAETQFGDITVFTTRHHTVFVDGDRRFKVRPNGTPAKHFFCVDEYGSQNRSRFNVWLQVIDRWLAMRKIGGSRRPTPG